MVRLDQLSVSFGDKVVLDRFSAELPDRGIIALNGPSGCGKTTLLRVLAGLQKAEGTVDGIEPEETVILFQENRLLSGRNARQQISDVLSRARKNEADQFLALVELEGEGGRKMNELSGGMQRRVALARALAMESRVLLLDEPFTGVDPARAARIVERIRAGGRAELIILSAHEGEILSLCDTVIHLEGLPLRVKEI